MKPIIALLLLSVNVAASDHAGRLGGSSTEAPQPVPAEWLGNADTPPASSVYPVRVQFNQWNGYQWAPARAIGSGVAIGPETVLTAYHVLQNGQNAIEIETSPGTWERAALTRYDQSADLAVLTCPDADLSPAELAVERPAYRQSVSVYGLASEQLQLGEVFHDGRFMQGGFATAGLEEAATGIVQGDSGGGVFTTSGELIGIIVSRWASNGEHEGRLVTFTPLVQVSALVTPYRSPASATPAASGDDTRPLVMIYSPPEGGCVYCEQWKQRWTEEGDSLPYRLVFETRGGWSGYPVIGIFDRNGREHFYNNMSPATLAYNVRRLAE